LSYVLTDYSAFECHHIMQVVIVWR